MKINDIFKIPVYETQLGLDVEQMKRYCLLHEIDNETRELSNAGGYQSNNLNGEFPDLNDLFVEINEHANNFSKTLQLGNVNLTMYGLMSIVLGIITNHIYMASV